MKSIIVVCLLLLPSTGMASQWCGFKGIYVGMSAEAAKKKGLSTCSKGQSVDEICKPDGSNKDLTTFGGEPTKGIEIGIQKGKVIIIGFKTEGRYGGGLEKTMITKYGKPAKKRGDWREGYYRWDHRDEYISLNLNNGVNEISFNRDLSIEDQRKDKVRRKKAENDM